MRRTHLFASLFFLIVGLTYSLSWGYYQADDLTNSDFLATYTALQLLWQGQGVKLYDLTAQTEIQHLTAHLRVPPADLLPFIHPPFYLFPLLPLAAWSYPVAFSLMAAINVLLMTVEVWLLPRSIAHVRPSFMLTLACFSFFPYFVTLIQGQNAALTLVIFTLAYRLFQRGNDKWAGAVLALALYKPQLVAVWVIVLLWKRRRAALIGFSLTALVLLGLSTAMVGGAGLHDYLRLTLTASPLVDGAYGVNYASMHNWRALFRLTLGPSWWVNPLTAIASLLTLSYLIWAWRGAWQPQTPQFDLQMALTIMTTLLISPHLNTHDLTLWVLVAALLWQPRQHSIFMLVGGSLLPFMTLALTSTLHLPLTTLFMMGLNLTTLRRIHAEPIKPRK